MSCCSQQQWKIEEAWLLPPAGSVLEFTKDTKAIAPGLGGLYGMVGSVVLPQLKPGASPPEAPATWWEIRTRGEKKTGSTPGKWGLTFHL